jgi:hypothetical protein
MKQKIVQISFMCFLSTIIIAACSKNTAVITPRQDTLSPQITSTTIKTLQPTSTQSQTPTMTLSPIPTNAPTLTNDDAKILLTDLLANNGNCLLPCLWGITPDHSLIQEAEMSLFRLGSISKFANINPGLSAFKADYIESDLTFVYSIGFVFSKRDNIVNRISFGANAQRNSDSGIESVYDSESFTEQISYYTLPNILSVYGKPDSVYIQAAARVSILGYPYPFDVVVLYPNQGILIQYIALMEVSGDYVLGCMRNSFINLELIPSGVVSTGDTDSLLQLVGQPWNDLKNYHKSIEDATSMTLEEFYEAFRRPTDQCIQTPSNIWPEPDY